MDRDAAICVQKTLGRKAQTNWTDLSAASFRTELQKDVITFHRGACN